MNRAKGKRIDRSNIVPGGKYIMVTGAKDELFVTPLAPEIGQPIDEEKFEVLNFRDGKGTGKTITVKVEQLLDASFYAPPPQIKQK